MRSLREPKALTIQPMRCRNDQNIAEILSKRPQQNSFQVVHFTSARRFDDGQRPDSQRRWGSMSAHQMICHLSDSFRVALGEKHVSSSSTLFKRTIYKWAALWVPFGWPHGVKTRPEVDQQQGGTRPVEFSSDVENLRILFERFCGWKHDFAAHAMFGQLSRGCQKVLSV